MSLAALYKQQNLLLRAIEVLEEGLELRPRDVYLLQELAGTYAEFGDTTSALGNYGKILHIDPSRNDVREEIRKLGGPAR